MRTLVVGLFLLQGAALGAGVALPMPPPPAAPPRKAAPPPALKPGERPKLLVSDLTAQDVLPAQAAAVTDGVVQTLAERGYFQVISTRDVQTLASIERQRQILGCSVEEQACAVNLGEALGARFVLSGSLSRLGDAYQLSLQVLDTVKGQSIGRSTRLAGELDTLRLLLPYAVAEATGSPLPPPPSRVLPYALIAAGGGAFVAGGFWGMLALSRERVLNDELCPGGQSSAGNCSGTNLSLRAQYVEENRSLGRDKTIALVLLGAGVAAAGAGLYLMPPPEGGPRVALVPAGSGVAFVGVLP